MFYLYLSSPARIHVPRRKKKEPLVYFQWYITKISNNVRHITDSPYIFVG